MASIDNSIPKLLITGATGNGGAAVISQLAGESVQITAGVRNLEKAQKLLGRGVADYHHVDFATGSGGRLSTVYQAILLIRLPQIGNAKRYFKPFIQKFLT